MGEPLCNKGFDGLSCMTGTVYYDPIMNKVLYDDTHDEYCNAGQTMCYKQTTMASAPNWIVKTVKGGCMNPNMEAHFDESNQLNYFAQNVQMTDYDFETCDES